MKFSRKLLLLLCLCLTKNLMADEGMWLPQLLQQLNEKDMKALGMKISAADIYNINKGSLKDAIVSFGGFCTAEVISTQGLLLTNHHCGYDAVQNHSTLEHNYLKDGFWARSKNEELPNEGLFATFIVRIDDVSAAVLKGVTAAMDEKARQSMIDQNIAVLKTTIKKEAWQDLLIRPFYYGNKYYLFVTETYNDVRLVGAPPSAIGKFGADTDNWVWPRHTGDFSMFRIYADKNNHPAVFSHNNVPYQPKKSLSISLDGVAENDFTMVFGFPGRTQEYLPAAAVELNAEVLNPVKIAIRDQTLKIWDSHMRNNEEVNIQYASKYAGMANSWKKWLGESQGIAITGAVAKRQAYESSFQKAVNASAALKEKYGGLLTQLNQLYAQIKPYALARDRFNETTNAVELFSITNGLTSLINKYRTGGEAAYQKSKPAVMASMEAFFKDYRPDIDEQVFSALMKNYVAQTAPDFMSKATLDFWQQNKTAEAVARKIYGGSHITTMAGVKEMLEKNPADAVNEMENDIAVQFNNSLIQPFNTAVAPQLNALQASINNLQRSYMQAQMDVFSNKRFYPDANSTLRVAYGKVKGYEARDAVRYDFYTYLDGVMEKYKPGDYEFDVPQKMIDLYKAKDYGVYGSKGKMPVCFLGTNHTTGGNSGSPALDAYGNLVGLNFDRVWEGTMSDLNYDPAICRNIMVDIRYVLFIIDKYAGATNLVAEMKLVHPKKKA